MRSALAATAVLLALALVAAARPATAQQVFWETEAVLRDFFPEADRVTYARTELDAGDLRVLEDRIGYRPGRRDWIVFVALRAGEVAGYAVIDDEQGQHEPITFAVRLTPDAVIDRVEVMIYREPYGDEVRDPRFRAQFEGLDWHDQMRLGRQIVAISGATISSRSLSTGARRVSAVVSVLRERLGVTLGLAA